MNPDCTTLGLIRTSLMNKERTWHGLVHFFNKLCIFPFSISINMFNYFYYRENRYLLFLTENYAALNILHHYLTDALKGVSISGKATRGKIFEPFVLFGSSFPKDKEYTQVKCIHNVLFVHNGYDRFVETLIK